MNELLKTMEDISNVEQQKAARLINDIKELLPSCSVHPFGSRVTGIATRTSDLDLYIDFGKLNFTSAQLEFYIYVQERVNVFMYVLRENEYLFNKLTQY